METSRYKAECNRELEEVLSWWKLYMTDNVNGGFYGKVDWHNDPDPLAPKGIVLNSRILWTFSAAYMHTKDISLLATATRAFNYISEHFADKMYGGVYWMVNNRGGMADGKKQIYGQAFCIYGLSEYYKATRDEDALNMAKRIFGYIEKYSLDKTYGGYLEAFDRQWQLAADLRLSDKDENEVKSMNTHLHVLEAYCNLYQVWQDEAVASAIRQQLDIFSERIIDNKTFHQHLFFAEDWQPRSSAVSFGHDIESAWLLHEAAEISGTPAQVTRFRELAVKLADSAKEGVDSDGGMWHEYDPLTGHWIKEKHWWPQAEAMVGFLNAWQLTGDKDYFDLSVRSWEFVKKHLKDPGHGEWRWGVFRDYSAMQQEDKAGAWKCPYHNGRALLEVIRRLS